VDNGRCAGVFLAVLLGGISLPGAAPDAPNGASKEEYRTRREALADELRRELPAGEAGVLILEAAPEPENLTYRQESNLYYLTGTEIPGSALVLLFNRPAPRAKKGARPEPARYAEYLYLPERDYRQERWTGPKSGAGGLERRSLEPDVERREAMSLTGFDRVPSGDYPPRRYPRGPVERRADLPAHLTLFLGDAATLFHPAEPGSLGAPLTPDLAFVREIRERFPWTTLKDPSVALGRLRRVKSPAELELLQRAVEISCHAQQEALRRARAGMAEYQVQALVESRFLDEGARRPAYPSIVGSGSASCILHYDANNGILKEGELLLLDAGAEYLRYAADVTRTFPVSGRFTPEQRKIYEIVLKAQEAAIAAIRPGAPFEGIDRAARSVITEAGFGEYFIHGTSHFIGLDVHDAGETSGPLQAGMVLTVEPGIYIPQENLGVRIEDDVVVTRRGARILSDCLPRKADAVEMQRTEGLKSEAR
jgi:Xaa-Pro aminopeptidase